MANEISINKYRVTQIENAYPKRKWIHVKLSIKMHLGDVEDNLIKMSVHQSVVDKEN